MKFKRLFFVFIIILFFLVILLMRSYWQLGFGVGRIENLIDELTISEDRQYKAFSEIEKIGPHGFRYLVVHLVDSRKLATSDVRLTNLSKRAPGSYFSAPSETVGEALLRYLCFRTDWCRADFSLQEFPKVKQHFETKWIQCADKAGIVHVDGQECKIFVPQ
jgi:hypothetical protein